MYGMGFKSWIIIYCYGATVVSARTCIEISPKGDKFVEVGEHLQVKCSLKVHSNSGCFQNITNKNISIYKVNKKLRTANSAHFNDKTSVVLTIHKTSFDDGGIYSCEYNGIRYSYVNVHIGEQPKAPKDLFCVNYDFTTFKCYFKLTETNIPTKTIVKFRKDQERWTTFKAPNCNITEVEGTCWLDNVNDTPSIHTFLGYVKSRYDIRVVTRNKLGKKSSYLIVANTLDIVRPPPVEIIYYTQVSCNSVSLHWRCPDRFIYKHLTSVPLDFRITITSDWHHEDQYVRNSSKADVHKDIKGLKPFTHYKVTVQVKPSRATQDIYWSDSSEAVSFVTNSTVSTNTVYTTVGSYMRTNTGQIVLYWKNPARRYWFGNITGYLIKLQRKVFTEKNIVLIQQHHLSEDVIGLKTSGALKTKLRRDESYLAQISIRNSEGVSKSYSEITIHSRNIGDSLKPSWVLVETAESSVDISWNMNPKYCNSVTTVTYYWCYVNKTRSFNNSFVICLDSFHWQIFNITDGCGCKHELPSDPSHLKFAVSLQTNEKLSGGIVWENFRFIKRGVPPEEPVYTVTIDGTKMKLHVIYSDYHISKGILPDSYSVLYTECEQEHLCIAVGIRKKFPVVFVNPVYIIDHLKPGAWYRVRLSSLDRFGRSTDGKSFTVKSQNDVKFTAVVEVAAGTISAVTVCCLVIVLVYYGKKKYRILEDRNRISTPNYHNRGTVIVESKQNTTFQGNQEYTNKDSDFMSFVENGATSGDSSETLLQKNGDENPSNEIDELEIDKRCILEEKNVLVLDKDIKASVKNTSPGYVAEMPGENDHVFIPERISNGDVNIIELSEEENIVLKSGHTVHDDVSSNLEEENEVSIQGNDGTDYVFSIPIEKINVHNIVFSSQEDKNILTSENTTPQFFLAISGEENNVNGEISVKAEVSDISIVHHYVTAIPEERSEMEAGNNLLDYVTALQLGQNSGVISGHNGQDLVGATAQEENDADMSGNNLHGYVFAVP